MSVNWKQIESALSPDRIRASWTSTGRKLLNFLVAVTAAISLAAGHPAFAVAENSRDENQIIDFDTEIIPVLTQNGCNAAACHGAAAGRGGFKLSLFGGDPNADFHAIAREYRGRRINVSYPDESLFLRKPTAELEHEGGRLLTEESPGYRRLINWIEQGAQRLEQRQLTELEVSYSSEPIRQLPTRVSVSVIARFDDGTERDVTSWSVFKPLDSFAVQVGAAGQMTIDSFGEHHVVIQFLDQQQVIRFVSPYPNKSDRVEASIAANWVDVPINEHLGRLNIPASPLANDLTRFRRVTLSLIGRLPTEAEFDSYRRADKETRYENWVDKLLSSQEFNVYWGHQVSGWLRVQGVGKQPEVAEAMRSWIEASIAKDNPWTEICKSIITAEGDSFTSGPAAIQRIPSDARMHAEYVSEVLIGVRLRCANCHNHPLDRWTQDDYHGLAAIFAKLDRGRLVRERDFGNVIHPSTGKPAQARLPGERFLVSDDSARDQLAQWLCEDKPDLLSQVVVNRVWKSLFGTGIVEPTDDFRQSNPASIPNLLAELAHQFKDNHYAIRPLIRDIVLSATFQRGEAIRENDFDHKYFSHFEPKPFSAALLSDAIQQVTGDPSPEYISPVKSRAIALANPYAPSVTLDNLGRCPSPTACSEATESSMTLATTLHLINGETLQERIHSTDGLLQKEWKKQVSARELVNRIYVRCYSRLPSRNESQFWDEQLEDIDRDTQLELLEDMLWSLLNSSEFRTLN